MTIRDLIIQLLEFNPSLEIALSNDFKGTIIEIRQVSGVFNLKGKATVTIDFDEK